MCHPSYDMVRATSAEHARFSCEGIHSTIGASVGLGVGLFLSLRLRRAGAAIYNAAKRVEKPTHLQFADGHTGEQHRLSNATTHFPLISLPPVQYPSQTLLNTSDPLQLVRF